MAHECEDCGETFETTTRLRLHDCGAEATGTAASVPGGGSGGRSAGDGGRTELPDVDEALDDVAEGDAAAVYRAVAAFESALSTAIEEGGGGRYREVFRSYHEPVSDGLAGATRAEGWSLLEDVVSAYDPRADDGLPEATPAIANAVGRTVVRTRLADGVGAVPAGALEYLDAVAVAADGADADVAREETHAYGWGIGHPTVPVVDRLRERVPEAVLWVDAALEQAFYADQYAAVEALEELVRDDAADGTLPYRVDGALSYRRCLLDCAYGLGTDDHWPSRPRYWDWASAFEDGFELDDAVEERIRALVAETGLDADLPADWTLRDLGI